MRVATYTQPTAITESSVLALAVLVASILLGTGVPQGLVAHFVPVLGPLVTFVWLGLYLLAFLGLMFGQGINWVSWLVRYRILLVLLLLGAIASVAWSIDSRVSAERTVHLVGTSLIGIYLGFTVPLLSILRTFAVVLAVVLIGSIAAALALPDLGVETYEGRLVWRGLTGSKNALGFWAATGVLLYVSLGDSVRSGGVRLLCFVLAGLSLAVLVLSQSATSLVALLVAGALALYLFIANRFRLGFVAMTVIALLITALVGLAITNIDTAELVGRTDDLTGRGEVWRQTWRLIMERPMTGYGYGALWFPNDATLWIQESLTDFTWIVHHAHNGFLQLASEIGLPLSVIALLMVVQQLIEIFYCQYQRQQPGVLFVLAFTVAYLLSNFSEARFLVTRELYWIFFIALPISMLRQINLVDPGTAEPGDDAPPDPAGGRRAERAGALLPAPAGGVPAMAGAFAGAAATGPGLAAADATRYAGDGAAEREVIDVLPEDVTREEILRDITADPTMDLTVDVDLGAPEDAETAGVPAASDAGAATEPAAGPESETANAPAVATPAEPDAAPERGGAEDGPDHTVDELPLHRADIADVAPDEISPDRYDKRLDLGDGTGDWPELPFGDRAGRR